MDIPAFYNEIDQILQINKSSFTDKFKLAASDLVTAVVNNDPAAVAIVLNAWVNPNDVDGIERMALPIAVENNNKEIVGLLLRKKASPNVLGKDGQSPLFKAVYWENSEIIILLLEAGADVNFPNIDGKTPLQEAQKNGYDEVVDLLTNYNKEKITAEELAKHKRLKKKAAAVKTQKIAKKKEEEQADLEKEQHLMRYQEREIQKKYKPFKGNDLRSLLQAIVQKDNEGVKYFIEKVDDLNQIDSHFQTTPLMMAVDLENVKLAQFFLKKGADPTLLVNEIYSPLTKAIRMELYKLVKTMLEHIKDSATVLNDPTQLLSPQFLAYKNAQTFNLLLEAGANPNFGGLEGVSPIRKAIEKAPISVLPVLSRHKVNLDQPVDGKRPLEWAVIANRTDWVNGLLGERAEDEFETSAGTSLIDLAKSLGDRRSIIALLETA